MADINISPSGAPANPDSGTIYYDSTSKAFKGWDGTEWRTLDTSLDKSIPHIVPNTLHPAIAGKGIDGSTTVTSFGTDFAISGFPTLQYYYTDIKGSKPIKDPRIGVHYGSQRHMTKSIQYLEDESSLTGISISSVDGRPWIRTIGTMLSVNDDWGNNIKIYSGVADTDYVEVVGYFSKINVLGLFYDDNATDVDIFLDGSDVGTDLNMDSGIDSPQGGRYVEAGGLTICPIGTVALGIHTVKLGGSAVKWFLSGIEFVTQDVTSSTTKNLLQIPAQTVVSYGRKLTYAGAVGASGPHHNPFATSATGVAVAINSSATNTAKLASGWSGTSSTYFSSHLDEETSLGLTIWESGGEFYRPVNGGRVVWWINDTGVLKCSVNMMPPAATAIGGVTDAAHNAPTGQTNWATENQPRIYSTTIDKTLSEVAHTFFAREFGNGAANAGTNSGTFADASMLGSSDNIAYVMDDGLTALSAVSATQYNQTAVPAVGIGANDGNYIIYFTFIGTGVSHRSCDSTPIWTDFAQNLPYGTHILKIANASSLGIVLDGLTLQASGTSGDIHTVTEISFHQPKRPPIPEDAVVLADYMLMADFVPQTDVGKQYISKGVRRVVSTIDHLYDGNSSGAAQEPANGQSGFKITQASSSTTLTRINSFCTNFVRGVYDADTRFQLWYANDTGHSSADATTKASGTWGSFMHLTSNLTLGMNTLDAYGVTGDTNTVIASCTDVATPIHTAHHYQSFESPLLHELIGGDRNVEQTYLVMTPDGKTWDEITRDTSYIGRSAIMVASTTTVTDFSGVAFDKCRGTRNNKKYWFNKYFAIAYAKFICLESGMYDMTAQTTGSTSNNSDDHGQIYVNGNRVAYGWSTHQQSHATVRIIIALTRGDYVEVRGRWYGNEEYGGFMINKL